MMVNGKPRELPRSVGLLEFLRMHNIKRQFVAVGYNGEVLEKDQFASVVLKDGDVLEIVRPVGGG